MEVVPASEPERALILSYAPPGRRDALAALLALDNRLAAIVRAAREPVIGMIRLTWWFEALERLDAAPPPAEPVLRAVAAKVLPAGVTGAALGAMVDGWERLLGDELDAAALDGFATERGGRLFAAAATVLGGDAAEVTRLGEGWALANLAITWSDPAVAMLARDMARARLGGPLRVARPLRPLGALVLLARSDLAGGIEGSPARVGRLAWHRLTGR